MLISCVQKDVGANLMIASVGVKSYRRGWVNCIFFFFEIGEAGLTVFRSDTLFSMHIYTLKCCLVFYMIISALIFINGIIYMQVLGDGGIPFKPY